MHARNLRRSALGLSAALALAACSDPATAPAGLPSLATASAAPAGAQTRLAVTAYPGRFPVLYTRDLDGTAADTARFDVVTDHVQGNLRGLLPVTDEAIVAMGPTRWSPDGSQLAVVMSVAYDQSQVVVMRADGRNKRTASLNGQIIMSDVAWSPDGWSIAYTMSTLPRAMGVDLFVTDLRTMRVKRLTTGADLGLSEIGWDAKGGAVYYTQVAGWQDVPPGNRINRIDAVNVASGETWTIAERVEGDVQGIARDGAWALTIRNGLDERGGATRVLARVRLPDGEEATTLAVDPTLAYAELVEGEAEAIVASASSPWSSTDTWTLVPLDGGRGVQLRGLGPEVSTVSLTRTAR